MAVATRIRSISLGRQLPLCEGLLAGFEGEVGGGLVGSAMCRLRMPVWEKIHSSEVSRNAANSVVRHPLGGPTYSMARITAFMGR